jgi:hydroxypyruvate isomerase
MPRFSANLGFLWPDLPLLARIEAAARAGFKAIELHFPYDIDPHEVASLCRRHEIELLGINTERGDTSKGETGLGAVAGREADFQALIDQSIEYSVAAGGRTIHAMAGIVPPERHREGRDVFVSNLRIAAEKASAQGLTLLLEPLNQRSNPGYFYSEIERAADIIERVAAPNVKVMFDCFHVGVSQGDVLTRLKTFYPLIGHVQIAAVPSRAEPDEGEIAYAAIFAALDELGYPGFVGCEYKPRAGTDEGLVWLKKLNVSL